MVTCSASFSSSRNNWKVVTWGCGNKHTQECKYHIDWWWWRRHYLFPKGKCGGGRLRVGREHVSEIIAYATYAVVSRSMLLGRHLSSACRMNAVLTITTRRTTEPKCSDETYAYIIIRNVPLSFKLPVPPTVKIPINFFLFLLSRSIFYQCLMPTAYTKK